MTTANTAANTKDPAAAFAAEVSDNIAQLACDRDVQALSRLWMRETAPAKYSYNFRWMGLPIIQYPTDILALQEIIWQVRPDIIIETGIARGGSVVFHASMLELLGGDGIVVGIDLDIRPHNRRAIEDHPMARRIRLVEGSSTAPVTLDAVRALAAGRSRALVILDSNHTHDHVLAELRAYAGFVPAGSYLVVLDTIVEDMPKSLFPDRPWGPGDNPKTAVHAFLAETDRFAIDADIHTKLLITVAPDGYLKCLGDP